MKELKKYSWSFKPNVRDDHGCVKAIRTLRITIEATSLSSARNSIMEVLEMAPECLEVEQIRDLTDNIPCNRKVHR